MQKKRHSVLETCVSTAIGFGVAYIANWFILPVFGMPQSHHATFWITVMFTAISLIRGYCVRRLFNWLHVKEIL